MKRSLLILALQSLCVMAASGQAPQGETKEQVWEWFQSAWDEARALPDLTGYVIEYNTEWHTGALSASKLAELRRVVQGRPDHPARRDIEVAERRLRFGPDVTECKLWIGSKERFRVARNPTYQKELPRADWAVTPSYMWRMTDSQLAIFEPDGEIPPGQDPRSTLYSTTSDVQGLLAGHLNSGPRVNLRPVELERRDDRWIVKAVADNGLAREYVIRWEEPAHRGFVESNTIVETSDELKDLLGRRFEYRGWHLNERPSIWIAERVDRYEGSGALEHSVVLSGIHPVSTELFSRLVKVPTYDGEDPDRGAITVTSVYDYRRDKMAVTSTGPEGVVAVRSLPGAASRTRLRTLGMVSIAGLIVLFVVLRARRAGIGSSTGKGVKQ